jgi:flagellar protein FlaJ
VELTGAGMPLHKAIIFSSHTDYGNLTSEVRKMSHQLSWNVNIINVLEQAQERLKKSITLEKVFRILMETYNSGGSIDSTLDSLSNTMMTIQDTEIERKSTLNQYVVAMYVISLVFIGIVVGINWLMLPIFQSMSTPTTIGSPAGIISNPCSTCSHIVDPACAPCGIYSSICSLFGSKTDSIGCYYLALFFSISIIQSLMGGLVAGQIGEGSVIAGIKHSLILVCISVASFLILVPLGLIGG